MPFSYPEIRTLKGLYLQPNTFTVPDGACEIAENVVIKNDNMISSRRGYYTYFDPLTGTLNNLFNYEMTLLAIYNDKLRYYTDQGTEPNETGAEHTLSGETIAVGGVVTTSRSFQANSNLYFTTDNGVLKLTAFDSAISKTGAPPGLDVSLNYSFATGSTFFSPGKTVGYRIVFGYTDDNDNLILGAPSQIAQIDNTAVTGSSYTSAGGGPWTVTVTSNGHGLSTGMYLNLYDGSNANADGTYQITVTGSNTFTYSVSAGDPSSGTVSYGYGMGILIEATIPSEITTALPWFYRIYRSSQNDISVGLYSDFKLIYENFLTSSEISSGILFFTDDVDDILRGTELYTNENSGEGELQANTRPPLPQDVTYFKNYAMYGNCVTRHALSLSVIDPTVLNTGDFIEVKIDSTTRKYVGVEGVGNMTVRGTASSSAGLLITYNNHGLLDNYTVYISNITGGTLTPGYYYVVSAAANTFKISLTSGGSAIAYNGETALYFEGDTDGTDGIFQISQSDSAAVRLRDTAISITKAINRDAASLIYGQYVSGINQVPGQMLFTAKGFTDPIYVRANSSTAGTAFSPNLPDSFVSGQQVVSKNDQLPHVIFISKLGEPEAVPVVNFLPAGSKNYPILRIYALRDSVIIIKSDGIYRLVGDNLSNFNITLLDGTVFCVANSSASLLNNQVIFLSNQGVCLVSESSVQIISRANIEDVIQPILGKDNLGTFTAGMGYETERLYLLTTTTPNEDEANVTYAFNILTNEWTTWDVLMLQGIVGPKDTMFYITTNNTIAIERKKQTKIDFSDQNYTAHFDAISGSELAQATITVSGGSPKRGDMFVKDEVITWIAQDPVLVVGNTYDVVLDFANNLEVGDDVDMYASFYRRIKWSPFHAGEVSRMKLFSQFIINLRDNALTAATISFGGNIYGASGNIDWVSELVYQGWGFFPWGFESWGQANSINLISGTQPAPIIRVLVPRFEARATFIQPTLLAHKAGESLDLQSIMYVVRPYNERVSR